MKSKHFHGLESTIEPFGNVGSVQLYKGDPRAVVKAPIAHNEKEVD